MPNPIAEARDFLVADAANQPAGTTHGITFPTGGISNFYVQYAWDGSPTDADNREDATVRFTVWGPKGRITDTADLAGGLRKRLLDRSSATCWRFDRGSGRLPGIDPDTNLPFCTFTVTAVMHAPA